jgi:hypothetical protein
MVNGPESNEWVPIGGQPLGLGLLVSVASQAGTTLLARTTWSGTGPPDRRTLDKTRMQVERPADHGRSASSPVELAGRQRSSTQVGAPAYSALRSIASAMAFIPVSFGCTPSPLLYSGRIRSGSVGSANTRSRSTTAS